MDFYSALLAKANGGGGGSSGTMVVNDVAGTLDKTWQEIHDAVGANKIVSIVKTTATPDPYPNIYDVYFVTSVTLNPPGYVIAAVGIDNGQVGLLPYVADSADGYPILD